MSVDKPQLDYKSKCW